MTNPADITVLICTTHGGIARTLRMALRGIGVRSVHLVGGAPQVLEGFATAEPSAVLVYVDGPGEADDGLATLRFLRRSEQSPNKQIPIVAVSPCRDLQTIHTVMDSGAHEYVLFPTAGDVLLRKITMARTTTRPFIDTADYVGPERRRPDRQSGPPGVERRIGPPPVIDATAPAEEKAD